ncbi:MAG: cyclopropane-fatty-acyl-phospholipid synthase [Gammaproteobacteria bacterium]|nr:cyclopropane-fatty-acyl-phospholipid synthase [Gammaproteobacteria bacterium]MDG2337464.1 cyclopropane-fatty-acyl-phospholipid synthase [Gammaproteobacteria bacterium]
MSIKESKPAIGLPFAGKLIEFAEQGRLPDFMVRYGIRRLCKKRLKDEFIDHPEYQQDRYQKLIEELRTSPIAIETRAANTQHYEVATDFYLASLGKRLKYSCAYYPDTNTTLDQAEEEMLVLCSKRAELDNDQRILELGCGWGSLTLWMAEKFPRSKITAISNSITQKRYIDDLCQESGFDNVTIITADVNNLELESAQFDRVISIEMFEHMRNYRQLFERISNWLTSDGKLFVHIFAHRNVMYPFDVKSEQDWMSKYFFTGGLMPSIDTLLHFQEQLKIESRWLINGQHYQKTCNHWLEKTDKNKERIIDAFKKNYTEKEVKLWFHRWRIFYMSCAELFGLDNGRQWLVAHYLFSNSGSNTQKVT